MTGVLEQVDVQAALAQLEHALDLLTGADLAHLDDEQAVAALRGFEQLRRGWNRSITPC